MYNKRFSNRKINLSLLLKYYSDESQPTYHRSLIRISLDLSFTPFV